MTSRSQHRRSLITLLRQTLYSIQKFSLDTWCEHYKSICKADAAFEAFMRLLITLVNCTCHMCTYCDNTQKEELGAHFV